MTYSILDLGEFQILEQQPIVKWNSIGEILAVSSSGLDGSEVLGAA